jgi:RNA:NAD 2'-phosphotransferase (TPT1/KptA family)
MGMLLGLGIAMGGDRLTKLSKYLSYHLRHAPQEIGLTLEPGGWVQIEDLLKAKRSLTRALYNAKTLGVHQDFELGS